MLLLFLLHVHGKYQEYASYVNTHKRNIIHTSIQTQRIKLKEVSVSRSTKIYETEIQNKEYEICQTKVQKTHCRLNLTAMTFENDMPMISAAI